VLSRADRAAATRARVIAIARRMFAANGFRNTTIEAVQAEGRLSRGALYHHFTSKEQLFEAVYELVEDETAEKLGAAARGAEDPLRAGCAAWLELARDADTRQITLIDGPAVIGWDRWSRTEDRRGLGLLQRALTAEAQRGRLDPELVDPVAHIMLASLIELGLMISRAEDPVEAQQRAERALDLLLGRLLSADQKT
jgi:AcrR family transcriptional regulator